MKARYLFPIIYIAADAASLLLISFRPIFRLITYFPTIPLRYIFSFLLNILNPPQIEYFVIGGTLLEFFLLGLCVELIAKKISGK